LKFILGAKKISGPKNSGKCSAHILGAILGDYVFITSFGGLLLDSSGQRYRVELPKLVFSVTGTS
jgi:hypothetical protein